MMVGGPGDYTVEEAITQAQALLDAHPHFVLLMLWCRDCQYARDVFRRYGVLDKIYVFELDRIEDQAKAAPLAEGFATISGDNWVPTIWFNRELFGTEVQLRELEEEGRLEEEFRELGLL